MRIKFLESALEDLRWFRLYYESIFPQGLKKAQKQYYSTKGLLKENPHIGHVTDERDGVREFSIPNIPFSFIYRVGEDVIEVLRVWDERQNRENIK